MSTNQNPARCPWVDLTKEAYIPYHDEDWGVPVHDDRLHFEFISLEGAQAGLSWYTVLLKRESYREAFDNFDAEIVARYGDDKVAELLNNPGIIRNRLKVNATIGNARGFLEVVHEYGSFDSYIWEFVGGQPKLNQNRDSSDFQSTSTESDALSKDLKQRGFKFVGSTICYSYLQAAGMVNDHTLGCFRRQEIIDSYQKCLGHAQLI